jgi:hypothetical protein
MNFLLATLPGLANRLSAYAYQATVVDVLIISGLVIAALLVGGVLGGLVIRNRIEQPEEVPSYLDVIRILIGASGNTPDYLGESVMALRKSQYTNANIKQATRRDFLHLQEGLLRQLERSFGLRPVAYLRNYHRGVFVEEYDPNKHKLVGLNTLRPGEQVYVLEPGWQIRSLDQGSFILLKKAIVTTENPRKVQSDESRH